MAETNTTKDIIQSTEFIHWTESRVNNATASDLTNYINERIAEYEDENLYGSELHGYYVADFNKFNITAFKKTTESAKKLRDFLRKRNVFIQKNRGQSIPLALVDAASKQWCPMPEDMISEVIEKYRPISNFKTSRNINPLSNLVNQNNSIITLMKTYTEDQKYAGTPSESFDLKYTIFLDHCDTIGISIEQRNIAFKVMLKDAALQYYHANCKPNTSSLLELSQSIKSNFEGREHKQSMLVKWNEITLSTILSETGSSDVELALNTLITKLRNIQMSLGSEFQSDKILYAKLLQSCRTHPACSIACSTIYDEDTAALTNRLRSNIATWKAQIRPTIENFPQHDHNDTEILFTDRRYYNKNNKPRFPNNMNCHRNHGYNRQRKVCFVCNREGCWSNRHSDNERRQARKRLVDAHNRRENRYFTETDLSDSTLNAFIQHYEGTDPEYDKDQDLIDAFHIFLSTQNTGEHEEIDEISSSQYLYTECGTLDATGVRNMAREMNTAVTRHALIGEIENLKIDSNTFTISHSNFNSDFFLGILIDTGAAGKSTAGYKQYQAYSRIFGKTTIDPTIKIQVRFGIGTTKSLGSIKISTPIGLCVFHVVDCNTPFLLSLQDLDNKGIVFNNLDNVLLFKSQSIPITRSFGHAFLQWGLSATTTSATYLTETELRTLHRRFGHPSAQRLVNVLQRSGHDNNGEHRQTIDKIIKNCHKCQRYGEAPMRFKFTLRDNDIDFNHSIFADIMYIDEKPLLHVVDEATRFQAARWLPNLSSLSVWDALRTCWVDTYLGPPDVINHDAGTNFTSSEFLQYSSSLGIKTKEIPVEAANSMGIVERYHKPLRRAYTIIKEELNTNNKSLILQMAVKAINDTAGPDGVVPTLLVFGAYPRMTKLDPPAPNIVTRAKAIQKAMEEVSKLRLQKQIAAAVRTRNGPTTSLQSTPIGTDILVWRTHKKKWEGPFKLLALNQETATIQLPSGPTNFRSTSIKPYVTSQNDLDEEDSSQSIEQNQTTQLEIRPQRTRRLPARFRNNEPNDNLILENQISNNHCPAAIEIFLTTEPQPNFTSSRQTELDGLLLRGVFKFVDIKVVPSGSRIFKSRFIDTIKLPGTPHAFEKSRLVIQGYNDQDKDKILTQSPTVQRSSQRLLISIAIMKDLSIYTRDITQAYVQSTTSLARNIFALPPKELNQPPNVILKLLKPLYGIAEAGTHWFQTYHSHHTNKLSLTQATSDPCLLYSDDAIVALQTDDTLFACNEKYKEKEQEELERAKFTAKSVSRLTKNKPIIFNGATYTLTTDGITITQPSHCQKLNMVPEDDISAYITQRARAAYISSVCQPQAAFDLSQAAQTTQPSTININALNKRLKWQMGSAGLRFVKLNETELRITVFTDSSFANNTDYSSQIGFIIILADNKNCNIIQWSSTKCKRVTRSVLASELYAMVAGFDAACVLKYTIEAILKREIPLVICIDSRSLYECIVKLGTTKEKRLMIDIAAIRQAYERREICQVIWIKGISNPADAMTKSQFSSQALDKILANKYQIDKEAWVDRDASYEKNNHTKDIDDTINMEAINSKD